MSNRKRPIETITLDDSDDEDQDSKPSYPYPPPQASTSGSARAIAIEEQYEEDLDRAIKASLEEGKVVGINQQVTSTQSECKANSSLMGGGMSRAEMERERLERIKNRQGDNSSNGSTSQPVQSTAKRVRIATLSDLPSTSLQDQDEGVSLPKPSFGSTESSNRFHSRLAHSSTPNPPSSCSSSSSQLTATSQRFYSGAIRRVPNVHHPDPSSSTSLSFSSLIGPRPSLLACIVSAFVLEPTWVVPQFPKETPLLLIMPRAKGDQLKRQAVQVGLGDKQHLFRVIPEDKGSGYYPGCMHTKLMVYFHDTFCRFIIPTANALDYDWATIDNAFYVHDFPLLPSPPPAGADPFKNPTHTQFSRNFLAVLAQLGAPKKFLSYIKDYDFESSKEVRLVHSLQGKYTDGEEFDKGGGLASLAKSVKSLGFSKGGKWEVEGTGSSIGRYTPTWLIQFLASCSGIHPTSYFTPSLTRQRTETPSSLPYKIPNKSNKKQQGKFNDRRDFPLKIIFPTHDEIERSHLGIFGGGTIFCGKKVWEDANFPRELFYRGVSKRNRIAAHTKLLLATHVPDPQSSNPVHEGYVYIGSHNLTPSAWGQLQTGSTTPSLNINNYELGVILPIREKSKEEFEKKANELVTYKRPLVPYSASDRPWMQDDHRDIYTQK